MPIDPIHPIYGTLDQFLNTLAENVRRGWIPHVTEVGEALLWYVTEFGKTR